MVFNMIGPLSEEERFAVSEVLSEVGSSLSDAGLPVEIGRCEKGVFVSGDANGCILKYSDRTALIRGIALLLRYAKKGEKFCVTEEAAFDTLGTMIDVSRNAVMKVPQVEKMIRLTALMGFNAMMLYTEDTFEVAEEPYFGHLRGRYTKEELKAMDLYAEKLGIELIPCIQTLAHLENMLKWPCYGGLRDWDDILNTADDRIYTIIERFVKSMSESLHSKKIDIGMDEAYLLGRGHYMDTKGYRDASVIMLEHLQKVVDICKKYDYKPLMWSDMFFRMCTEEKDYYGEHCNVTEEIKKIVPPEITLIYWDYYGAECARYDRMIDNHLKFNNPVAFAGGTSSWYGIVPLNTMSVNFARAAMKSARSHGVKEIYVTMWGDGGASCSQFATIPTLACYGENNWNGDSSDENLREAVLAETNCSYDSFMDFERMLNIADSPDYGFAPMGPLRYTLFQDVLQGRYDAHIPDGANQFYAAERDRLIREKAEHQGSFGYLYDSFIALMDVLSVKAEIGKELKKAYDAKDRAALKELMEVTIPTVIDKLDDFHAVFRKQWMKENKAFGFEVQDIRFGGLTARLVEASAMIEEYLNGEIPEIEELEAPRLSFDGSDGHGPLEIYSANNWVSIVTAANL